jgi:hypothetical protein
VRLVVASCLVATGCFYIDPINRGPSVSIVAPTAPIERGKPVTFTQMFGDPEQKPGTFQWNVSLCDTVVANIGERCDDPFISPEGAVLVFDVPRLRADRVTPSTVLDVSLDARDDRGANVHHESVFMIRDSAPEIAFSRSATHSVGAPIDVKARYGDADDDLGKLTVTWAASSPRGAYALADLPATPDDAGHVTERKRLIPDAPGDWHVVLTVADHTNAPVVHDELIPVTPDGPPCLAQWQPIVPPSDATLPVGDKTVFQVPLVEDDLDAYPPDTSDPLFGTARFAWSVRAPGDAARRPIGSGNSVDFDPRGFTPGDVVEVRVEVFDRHAAPIACGDGAPTCGEPACLQRQTWRVEVR